MRSVFLAYHRKDKEVAAEVYRRLTRDGVSCFFDHKSTGWGDDWRRTREQAMTAYSDIVFLLSPEFCRSTSLGDAAKLDTRYLKVRGARTQLHVLMVRECREDASFPPFLDDVAVIDISSERLFEAHYAELCLALGGVVQREARFSDRGALPPVRPLLGHSRLTYESLGDRFVGRTDTLWRLHDVLGQERVCVLAGTGGLGKTQAAVEYVYRFSNQYPGGVYWVDADCGLETFTSQVAEAAEIFLAAQEQDWQREELWRLLNEMPPSLIVLDNFPKEIPLQPYLPDSEKVRVLITTRREDTTLPTVELPMLRAGDGVALMTASNPKVEAAEADALFRQLGGLPIVLDLATNLLKKLPAAELKGRLDGTTAGGENEDFLRGFIERHRAELPKGHEYGIARMFLECWELLRRGPKYLARVMALLAPLPVPAWLLRDVWQGLPSRERASEEFETVLRELADSALVDVDTNDDPCMHALVHAFVGYANEFDGAAPGAPVAKIVLKSMPGPGGGKEIDMAALHAEALLSRIDPKSEDSVELLSYIGAQHQNQRRYDVALSFVERSLQKAETVCRLDDSRLREIRTSLALLLQEMGRLDDARDRFREMLARDEKILKPGDPIIAADQVYLASTLEDLEQLPESLDLLERALSSFEKALTPGDSRLLSARWSLVGVLKKMGRLTEARDQVESMLETYSARKHADSLAVAHCQDYLAFSLLRELGEFERAAELLQQALASRQQQLEPDDHTVLETQERLAQIFCDLGWLDEERELREELLKMYQSMREPDDLDVASQQKSLASVLHKMGDDGPAEDLLRRCLDSYERVLKAGDPLIAGAQTDLAHVLRHRGNLAEAVALENKLQQNSQQFSF